MSTLCTLRSGLPATGESARGYPAGLSLVEAAVRQVGELREPRALPELDRLLSFPNNPPPAPLARDPRRLIALASEAAARIVPPETLAPFRSPTVLAIAARIADTADAAAMPVLADALEEAGCIDADILGHLRGPGPHARGCHVLDALLGKE